MSICLGATARADAPADPHDRARSRPGAYFVVATRRLPRRMEHTGVPMDVDTLSQLRAGWDRNQARSSIAAVDAATSASTRGRRSRAGASPTASAAPRMPWPLHSTSGRLELDGDTFADMAKGYPELRTAARAAPRTRRSPPRSAGGRLRWSQPHAARRRSATATGRNAPSNTKFIFGPAVWLRGLIKPGQDERSPTSTGPARRSPSRPPCRVTRRCSTRCESGDLYLGFARRAGLAPPGATKATHGDAPRPVQGRSCSARTTGCERGSLAMRTGLHEIEAAELMRPALPDVPSLRGVVSRQCRPSAAHRPAGDRVRLAGARHERRHGRRAR